MITITLELNDEKDTKIAVTTEDGLAVSTKTEHGTWEYIDSKDALTMIRKALDNLEIKK